MRHLVLITALCSCGVRTPARIDTAALVKRLGPVDARHELEIRVIDDPKDIAARLALAKLCEEQHRPAQAIEQLDVVTRLGGPIGTRWHDDDRLRFARLLALRGRDRLARGSPSAQADFESAREYGAKIDDETFARAKLARAITQLRHAAAKERAAGLATLRSLAGTHADPNVKQLGVWLWSVGAKRAAWDELSAWHDATPPPRDEALQSAYLVARAWWKPVDSEEPPAIDLVGPERCRYRTATCEPWELVQNAISSDAISALVVSPPSRTSDPNDIFGWLAITLGQALRGDGAWGALLASRVDGASIDKVTPGTSTAARLVFAASAALRGRAEDVRATLEPIKTTPEALAILAAVDPPPAAPIASPVASAVSNYVRARLGIEHPAEAVVQAYAKEPNSADRVGHDAVAQFADGALGHAWLAAIYDGLEDPARARAEWQAAVDGSPEPLFVRGLAEAIARAHDPDAALVIGTQAAAADGDPAVVWTAIAEALHGVGSDVHAIEAARSAIDLASAETIGRALDVAIEASESLGRTSQANALRTRRSASAVVITPHDDASDPRATTNRWAVSRLNPRDVAIRVALLDDPAHHDAAIAELVSLAGDRDSERGRAAIRALRATK